ncbi:hypothetical protein BG015_008655 [Linnemannia schmuckeri]|uniref:Uncharacterized protein n=1 Tax=Linnemannia schmuckeri TaxID=64567 RepID=A0A9P5VAD2_9FUNG|nr:hypothetical protein BG015_008655 [Linnemannia schmuckeri]
MGGSVASHAYGAGLDTSENICDNVDCLVAGHIHHSPGHILSLCNGSYLLIDIGIRTKYVM